ncbi:hypothetical protein [Sphingosinithalassobacter portus]|uniref:hypothetical protein n=1 Tax=Stakelama portus TaxID=2676234 RepID=UPI0011AB874D|nr:hypothetical protein [Sphingosinithalassobacter portus]
MIGEDHSCRVRRGEGRSPLVHYRFGDAPSELAQIDGEQAHRGAWAASGAVAGAAREGRRWMLLLSDGSRIPVSASHLPRVRERSRLAQSARRGTSGVAMPDTNA